MTDEAQTIDEIPFDYDYTPGALEVRVSELVVATAEHNDPMVDEAIRKVLRLLREQHHTEAAFVSEFIDGRRVQRTLATPLCGRFHNEHEGDVLEFVVGRQVVPGSAAASGYFSVPVVLVDGRLYGTLYAPCFTPSDDVRERDLKRLEMTAQLAARLIDARRARPAATATPEPHCA